MIELVKEKLSPANGFKTVCHGLFSTPSSEKELRKITSNSNKQLLSIRGNQDLNRAILEQKQVSILQSPEFGISKDSLHQRHSGLNHILCALAKKNNIAIGFDISQLLKTKGKERSLILGKMQQNVVLCRKYKVKMLISSFASNKYEQRSSFELKNFGLLLGMTQKEANDAVCMIEQILKDKEEQLRSGLRIIKE